MSTAKKAYKIREHLNKDIGFEQGKIKRKETLQHGNKRNILQIPKRATRKNVK